MKVVCLCVALLSFCTPAISEVVWSNGCDSASGWGLWAGCTWPTFSESGPVYSGPGSMKVTSVLNRISQSFSTVSGATTLSFWLYDGSPGIVGSRPVVDIRTSVASVWSLMGAGISGLSADESKYGFRVIENGVSTQWVAGSVSRSFGWHHMECAYDGLGSVTFSVDGVSAWTHAVSSPMTFGAAVVGSGYGSSTTPYEFRVDSLAVSAVPEPSSILALLGGLAGLLSLRRRRA